MKRTLTVFFVSWIVLSLHLSVQAVSVTVSDDLTSGLGSQTHEINASYPFGFLADPTGTFNGTSGGAWASGCGNGGTGGCIQGAVITHDSATVSQATISLDLGGDYTVTEASFWARLNADSGYSSAFWIIAFYDSDKNLITYDGVNDPLISLQFTYRREATSMSVDNVHYVAFTIEYNHASAVPWLDDISVTYDDGTAGPPDTSGFMRPLALEDETAYGLQDKPDTPTSLFDMAYVLTQQGAPPVLQGVSVVPGDYVHSMTDGVVTAIRPLDPETDCGLFAEIDGRQLDGIRAASAECWVFLLDGSDNVLAQVFDTGYIVQVDTTVSGDSVSLSYVVENPSQYVSIGDSVSPGCVLGWTVALQSPNTVNLVNLSAYPISHSGGEPPATPAGISAASWIGAMSSQSGLGFTAILAYDTDLNAPLRLTPTDYPSNDTPCKSKNPNYADCLLSNPTFANNGEGWSTNDISTVFLNPGLGIGLNGRVWRSMLLDSATDYTLSVGIDTPTSHRLRLFVEQGAESYQEVIPLDSLTGQLDIPSGTLSATQVYNVGIQGLDDGYETIRYLCLTAGSPNVTPGSCYFNNAYFDFGTSGWTLSSDATALPGVMRFESGGTFAQSVHLTPGDYTLAVKINTLSTVGYTPPPDAAKLNFSYVWDAGSVSIGDIDLTAEITPDTVSVPITVSTENTDTMTITAQFRESDDTPIIDPGLLVQVDSACLAGTFTGGGGTEPPFVAICQVIPVPDNNDIGPWITYLWRNLNKFFTCTLMTLLRDWYAAVVNFFRTIGFAVRWWLAAFKAGVSWSNLQLFPWLNGQFANMANPPLTIIQTGGGSDTCNNLFCALVSLFDSVRAIVDAIAHVASDIIGFFQHLFDLVAGLLSLILNGLISMILLVVTEAFRLINFAISILTGIVNGYQNATPQSIPGLADCTLDAHGNALCQAAHFLDNTVFADGQPGALLIPIIISIGSLFLLIWIIGQFSNTVMEASKVS